MTDNRRKDIEGYKDQDRKGYSQRIAGEGT